MYYIFFILTYAIHYILNYNNFSSYAGELFSFLFLGHECILAHYGAVIGINVWTQPSLLYLCLQMDGDSSTTDTTQLGITGEYMTGGTYVLQTQDGKDMMSP